MIIDLTVPLSEDTPVYPGDPSPKIKQAGTFDQDGYNDHTLTLGTHIGTHIDAPYHMIPDGKKLNEFSTDDFVGRGVCIDATNGYSFAEVSKANIQEGNIVLFMTGWENRYHEQAYFEEYTSIPKEVAQLLVERKVKMVGLDACSPDHEPFEIHKILLGSNILLIENLTNLDQIIGRQFTIYALPLSLAIDGSPARVIAEIRD